MNRWVKISALAVGAAFVVATAVLIPLAGVRAAQDYADPVVLVPLFWSAGAVAFWYRPQLRGARLLYLAGTLIAAAHALATLPAVVHADGMWVANLASQVSFVGGFAAWAIALALFPDGAIETWAERSFTGFAAVAAVVLPTAGFFSASRQELIGVVSTPATPVPVWTPLLAPLHSAAQFVPASVLIGAVLLGFRYRHSSAERRDQIRWPLIASAAAAIALVTSSPITALLGPTAQTYVFVLIVATLPATLVLAMFRGRLFDVDRLVLRSLVFAALWIVIAAVYALVAGAFGVAAGHQLALGPAVAVAILAAMLFQPARARCERLADRWAYGDRLSGLDALRSLGNALERSGDTDAIAHVLAATVQRGLRCEWARVRAAGSDEILAFQGPHPPLRTEVDLDAPLRHGGDTIGWIECGSPRSSQGSDLALLADLARQASPALHNAELNRRLERQVGELSASRSRLVRAEERERRRIERDLHDGVQAQLVAVAAKVDLVRLQLASGSGQVQRTLDELSAAVRNTHLELRELVRGIHPAALEDHGLVRAIEDRTADLPIRVLVEANVGVRESRLPSHLEGAAYFFAIEGVTNVLRHAKVNMATVSIEQRPRELRVEVVDGGCGFGPNGVARGGLRGLADRLQALGGRLDIESAPGAGTRLLAVLPVDAVTAGRDE